MRHLLALILLVFLSAPVFAQNVTVTNAMAKVHPTDGATTTTTAEIHAAQNEFEAFQLIVTGPATPISPNIHNEGVVEPFPIRCRLLFTEIDQRETLAPFRSRRWRSSRLLPDSFVSK
jgi:hypothetical protein